MMRDVTEARQRELVRETFIGVLSHELRTPVTTIFGGAKLLAREISTLDEETKRGIFRDIHDEAERLQRLVEDVVALNRFGEGRGEIGWEPVLLQRLVPRVVQSEEGRWPGVTFVVEMAPGLPTVTADPTYVEQVIRNLLSNAAKYGGTGSTVTITSEAGDGEVIVRVLDDGPGFPAEEAPACSSCSTARRGPRRPPAAPGSGCSCAPGSSPRWAAGSGRRRATAAARNSGSRWPSSTRKRRAGASGQQQEGPPPRMAGTRLRIVTPSPGPPTAGRGGGLPRRVAALPPDVFGTI